MERLNIVETRLTELLSQHPEVEIDGRESLANRLLSYLELIEHWTKTIDLVANASFEVLFERHISDSLIAAFLLIQEKALKKDGHVIDVGTGAGLPGIVFAILMPKLKVSLCEPRDKRVIFLKEAVRTLKLENTRVYLSDMEALIQKNLDPATLTIARALGRDEEFLAFSDATLEQSGTASLMVGYTWLAPASVPEALKILPPLTYCLTSETKGRQVVCYQKL